MCTQDPDALCKQERGKDDRAAVKQMKKKQMLDELSTPEGRRAAAADDMKRGLSPYR